MKLNLWLWVLSILLVVTISGLGYLYFHENNTEVSGSTGTVKYAIPHMASFKCEVIGHKYGQTIVIPENGATISKQNVGFYTDGMKNIILKFTTTFWQTDWATRVSYTVCDQNGYNCGPTKYKTEMWATENRIDVDSIDFRSQSLKLLYERIPWYLWEGYTPSEGLSVTFDADQFGLTLYSTTYDPAGAKICTTSCNLDCPDIGYRQKLLLTDATKLDFYGTAPYLEYWETIDYDLNAQGGATIYNAQTNTFCFAGAVYTAGELKMDNGATYIYPLTNTRQIKPCCPGAVISSTYSDLVCQSDYTWKVIRDTDKLTCFSDYNCPSAGGAICQNKVLSGYHCTNRDSNNVGLCVKENGISVACCLSSDCNTDQVCDLATHTCKGGSILPVCGDNILQSGEKCDDGNTANGDGCNSKCELEGNDSQKVACLEKGWTWVETETCNFWCKIGISDPVVSGYCKEPINWSLYLLIAGGVVVLIVFIVTLPKLLPNRQGRPSRIIYRNRRRKRR